MNIDSNSEDTIQMIDTLEEHIRFQIPDAEKIRTLIQKYPMKITPYYLNLVDWGDPQDPIRKMAIPSHWEQDLSGDFDTSGELVNTKFRGVQHKYPETALILMTNQCAVYCRHCFRKRFVGLVDDEIVVDWERVIAYLIEHQEINNVLLSGGDPLILSASHLGDVLHKLSGIPHLQYVRIGSRIPVVSPHRIINDDALHDTFKTFIASGKQLYVTTQFNHPRELTSVSARSVKNLRECGVIVNNQTVLLNGINSCSSVIAELQTGLVHIGVIPYYIFQCRPVMSVKAGFQVSLHDACYLIDEAREKLDGLSKRFRFVLSHPTGKIEILGWSNGGIYAKYHQTGRLSIHNKIFHKKLARDARWIDFDHSS